jgi:hypothetical protein
MSINHGQSTHEPCKNKVVGKDKTGRKNRIKCGCTRFKTVVKGDSYACRKCGHITDLVAIREAVAKEVVDKVLADEAAAKAEAAPATVSE